MTPIPTNVPVRFEPSGATSWVAPGTTLLEAAQLAGVLIAAPCAGRGICGACAVRVEAGVLEPTDEQEQIGLTRAPRGVRLACRARVSEAVTVRPLVAVRSASARRGEPSGGGRIAAGVDLGTTTVSAALVDAVTGAEIGRASTANRQQSFGADVLSRIAAALEGHGAELQQAARASVLEALAAACPDGECMLERVASLAIAANSAMAALLVGSDPSPLASAPFAAPIVGARRLAADDEIVARLEPGASALLLPAIDSFVGGDTTAGLIATGLLDAQGTRMLVDLGTNAEIALVAGGRLYVASAAAGPAFEATGVSCGGPAAPGAVVDVHLADDLAVFETIGGGDALWFAGSGLIAAIDELRNDGHLSANGLLLEEGPLAARFSRDQEGVLGVDLSTDAQNRGSRLRIDQRDVRALQLAKAAVAVGIDMVLSAARVRPHAVRDVYLAGSFGASLDPARLVRLGVLPSGLSDVTAAVADAALDGAVEAALRPSLAMTAAAKVADATRVELAGDPTFNVRLLDALAFEPTA